MCRRFDDLGYSFVLNSPIQYIEGSTIKIRLWYAVQYHLDRERRELRVGERGGGDVGVSWRQG